jgi:hypothetical protein
MWHWCHQLIVGREDNGCKLHRKEFLSRQYSTSSVSQFTPMCNSQNLYYGIKLHYKLLGIKCFCYEVAFSSRQNVVACARK